MMILKAALAPILTYLGAVLAAADVNTYMAIFMALVALAMGPRYLRVRDLRTQNDGLREALATAQAIKTTDDERKLQLEADLAGAQARANAAEKEAEGWKRSYHAIEPYTARPAFDKLEELIERMAVASDKRHSETIDLFRRLAGEKAVTDQ